MKSIVGVVKLLGASGKYIQAIRTITVLGLAE